MLNNQNKAIRVKVIKQMENVRATYKRLKLARNKYNDGQGLRSIIIPTEEGEKVIDDPNLLETYIIQRNLEHFSQAQDTPFMSTPLTTEIGWNADTPTAT